MGKEFKTCLDTQDSQIRYERKDRIGVGFRMGKLTVVEATDLRRQGYTVWHCRCDCGGEILLDTRYLKRGTVKDCGRELDVSQSALKSGHTKGCASLDRNVIGEYVGRRFGMLVVTAYDGKRDGQHYWRCKCDCGHETVVGQTNLQSGHTKSCGCLQREVFRDNLKLIDGTSITMIESRKKRPIKTNTSGYNGVYWNRKNGTWTAQITFKGRIYYLGTYPTILEAVEARKLGEEMYDDFLEWYYRKYGQSDARHSLPCQATVSGGESE